MKSFNRRNFLKKTATGAAGLAVVSSLKATNRSGSISRGDNKKVITRKLGNTGIEIPVVSMGCGRVDSPSIVKGALKLGINHFDTAYVYQKGNSEKMLGETLVEYPRESFTVATKVKLQDSKEKFLEMLEESLERLKMSYVDILYLHNITNKDDALNTEMLDALKQAKKLGKAKHIGISTHKNEPEVIQAAIDSNLYEVVLTSVNFKQEHYSEIQEKIKIATDKGIGIVAMKVMAGGFLDKDRKNAVNHKAALKWALKDPNVHTAIPSMINLEQLQENTSVLTELTLSEEENNSLVAAKLFEGLYCNACEICIHECKKSLPIAEFMRAYMYSYGYKDSVKAKQLITELGKEEDPCAGCNTCTVNCVKSFNIADRIKDISRLNSIPEDFLA